MVRPIELHEALEPRMLLSAATSHMAGAAAPDHTATAAIHVNLQHPAKVRVNDHNGGRHRVAAATTLPTSRPFSYTYGGYTLSGSIDGSTHAVNATITGHGLDLTVAGTVDPATHVIHGTITGADTNLEVNAILSGKTLTGSLQGTFMGFPVSYQGTLPI